MKKLVVGILAHVDAGKTTLSEALLYLTGEIRRLGRVDHRDAFLDTHTLERAGGITIFSKQARFHTGDLDVTLLDTPGHADLSTEMERTLQVLDCAILIISGADGIQAHTETLWRLLQRRRIPVFLFINKMDLPGPGRQALMEQLRRQLDEGCVCFGPVDDAAALAETLALCDEALLERYMQTGQVSDADVSALVQARRVFPCYFGSALRLEGVEAFLQGLARYAQPPQYGPEFAAKVFKIGRDAQGARLTYLKVTGGSLRARAVVTYRPRDDAGGAPCQEKVSQLRIYSGARYTQTDEVTAGDVCAVLGLTGTYAGQGLGAQEASGAPVLEPVLTCRVCLPDGCDARTVLPKLQQLEEEDPTLHVVWNERLRQIQVRLAGEVQREVLQALIAERFGLDVRFDEGRILYLETIAAPVEGVGHFEPLRHYAEVHLLLEPLERGSGLEFATNCSEDVLDRNWQRLILTHLEEKTHVGVLTGSPITDLRITLRAGRAHIKHTEGGDFRQATYRAVRQGLMQAQSVLLEPCYRFRLTVPSGQIGRAISDMRQRAGTFSPPQSGEGELMELCGTAPVSALRGYAAQVAAYTRGRGRLSVSFGGYAPCRNAQAVIDEIGYDPLADVENTPDSVFCAHGAGMVVRWDEVPSYMHLESCLPREPACPAPAVPRVITRNLDLDEKELQAIIEREFGPRPAPPPRAPRPERQAAPPPEPPRPELLIVDGYNVIFDWPQLRQLAAEDLQAARSRLLDILANYRGLRGCELIVVFDGYRVPGNPGEHLSCHGVHVVYTKANETGDLYIERLADEIGKNHRVRVVTSDGLIRLSALRSGILRVSAPEFGRDVEQTFARMRERLAQQAPGGQTLPIPAGLSDAVAAQPEEERSKKT